MDTNNFLEWHGKALLKRGAASKHQEQLYRYTLLIQKSGSPLAVSDSERGRKGRRMINTRIIARPIHGKSGQEKESAQENKTSKEPNPIKTITFGIVLCWLLGVLLLAVAYQNLVHGMYLIGILVIIPP